MLKLLISLFLLLSLKPTHIEEGANKVAKPIHTQSIIAAKPKPDPVTVKIQKVENVVESRPKIDGIPLPEDILDYMWDKSKEYQVSYELLLAIAKVESDFNYDEKSPTNDFGIMQIHRPTDKWISEQLGINKYRLNNPRTSITFAAFYLNYLREQYTSHGLSEEDAFDMTVIAYNRGIAGANRWVKRHGVKNTYLERVTYWKEKYENGGVK